MGELSPCPAFYEAAVCDGMGQCAWCGLCGAVVQVVGGVVDSR